MGNNNSNSRTFKWDAKSAGRKLTGNYDPNKDAFRKCSNCGKHINKHKDPDAHKPMPPGSTPFTPTFRAPLQCPEKQRTIPGIEGVITDRGLVTRKGTAVGR